MGLDLWFRADVARILQATHEAMCSTAAVVSHRADDAAGRERAAGYREGFEAALRAVATAFGLTEPGGVAERWQVIDGQVARTGKGNHNGHNSPDGDLRGHNGVGAWD